MDQKRLIKRIGSNLRTIRIINGLTQRELGRILNVTCQQVQKYESGTNRISADTIFKISRNLGISYDYFFAELDSNDKKMSANDEKFTLTIMRYLSRIGNNKESKYAKLALLSMLKFFCGYEKNEE